jgi:hypothetical protein
MHEDAPRPFKVDCLGRKVPKPRGDTTITVTQTITKLYHCELFPLPGSAARQNLLYKSKVVKALAPYGVFHLPGLAQFLYVRPSFGP